MACSCRIASLSSSSFSCLGPSAPSHSSPLLRGGLAQRLGRRLGFKLELTRKNSRQWNGATVCMVLPTGKPDATLEKDKQAKWSARAIKAFSMAELEARKMKYATTGTESLLMGILTEGTSKASLYLRANGVTLFKVRNEAVNVLGKADMYFFSPEHPPLTEPAQQALDWAVDEHQKLGANGEISTMLLLLGIWEQKNSAGQKILAALGFDDKKAQEILAAEREDLGIPAT
ncbi:ATP-dependent Clp protease ATP-binding subunit CLPT1, chloroplastic [Selaginella moellendorffii]|uniref:ATP-dependent Clp protease ATP-binding subunit CLPT1, chloroplastic n=1 Tax=Selaginella moellendorffii TaxID=88036 RepID=UPI000D1C9FBB|nr:ATP-dependent Clp protease ATP-binding subunit CLPT1, chloroplastic [Selaginella moellendorffii]|eukprot:XP_002974678.2 ATP-dependent Clp protease ATP-binding subunit CLPT1, chloroplastic [Selaginella moellendorffii]